MSDDLDKLIGVVADKIESSTPLIEPVSKLGAGLQPELAEAVQDLVELSIQTLTEVFLHGTFDQQLSLATKLAPFFFKKTEDREAEADALLNEARRMIMEQWVMPVPDEVQQAQQQAQEPAEDTQ